MIAFLARVLMALLLAFTAAISAPRSALHPTADPVDVSGFSASVAEPSGAPSHTAGAVTPASPEATSVVGSDAPYPVASPLPVARRPAIQAKPVVLSHATPRPVRVKAAVHTITGYASWYGTGGPGLYAALHDFVDGTRVQVAICAYPNGQASCVTVPVVTQCGACRWRAGATVVDLSVPAFLALGVPLSVGLVKVTVELLG